MNPEEIEYAYLEGALRAITADIDEQYGGRYSVSFTIEKVSKGEMG